MTHDQWVMWVTLNRPTCSIRQVAPRWTLTFLWRSDCKKNANPAAFRPSSGQTRLCFASGNFPESRSALNFAAAKNAILNPEGAAATGLSPRHESQPGTKVALQRHPPIKSWQHQIRRSGGKKKSSYNEARFQALENRKGADLTRALSGSID